MNGRITGANVSNVTLEVLDIDGIKADDGTESRSVEDQLVELMRSVGIAWN